MNALDPVSVAVKMRLLFIDGDLLRGSIRAISAQQHDLSDGTAEP